jgi:hypothetical protein
MSSKAQPPIQEILRLMAHPKEVAVNSRKLASPKRCKNASVVREAQSPVGPGEFFHKFKSRSFTTRPRLSASTLKAISPTGLPNHSAAKDFTEL